MIPTLIIAGAIILILGAFALPTTPNPYEELEGLSKINTKRVIICMSIIILGIGLLITGIFMQKLKIQEKQEISAQQITKNNL